MNTNGLKEARSPIHQLPNLGGQPVYAPIQPIGLA